MVSIPTIHKNGTSGAQLLDEYIEVVEVLRAAEKALKIAAPNGRDYYPQGPMAVIQAQDEHAARLRKLEDFKKEIEEIVLAIVNGGHKQ